MTPVQVGTVVNAGFSRSRHFESSRQESRPQTIFYDSRNNKRMISKNPTV